MNLNAASPPGCDIDNTGYSKQVADTVTAIDALLPQTQCTRCGYPDCRAYARAIAEDSAPINRCPPGGRYTIGRLAALLNTTVLELDPECGAESPRQLALVDEQWCIGCALCIQACPVDAIVGAAKRMHTVIAPWCNGCELCLAPCPVDCIELAPTHSGPENPQQWLSQQAGLMRERYQVRQQRMGLAVRGKVIASAPSSGRIADPIADRQQRRERIARAVAREHSRRGHESTTSGQGCRE